MSDYAKSGGPEAQQTSAIPGFRNEIESRVRKPPAPSETVWEGRYSVAQRLAGRTEVCRRYAERESDRAGPFGV